MEIKYEDELIIAIVKQACDDWRLLCKKKIEFSKASDNGDYPYSFSDIRRFLESDYCDMILENFNVDPKLIIEKLEKERIEAFKGM